MVGNPACLIPKIPFRIQDMPYSDLDQKRKKQRIAYMKKYRSNRKFREKEAARKARYYQENPEYQEALKLKVYQSRGLA